MFERFKRRWHKKANESISEWGIFLGGKGLNFLPEGGIRGLRSIPYKVKISVADAEKFLAQDQRIIMQMSFGRWHGDTFEAGEICCLPNTSDLLFVSPDRRVAIRVKSPPPKLAIDCVQHSPKGP